MSGYEMRVYGIKDRGFAKEILKGKSKENTQRILQAFIYLCKSKKNDSLCFIQIFRRN
jgi:hypothetical protein